jgi:outer membrane biosynthesis protein TonB
LAAALLSPSFALAQAPSAATAAQGAPQLPDFKLPPGATDPSPTGPLHTCHYPTALARQHVSGTDIVGVKVGTAGTVEDSVIVQSSGSLHSAPPRSYA